MKSAAYFFITIISTVFILVMGKNFLLPLVFAILLWFLVRKSRHLLDKVKLIKKHFAPWIKNLITSLILLVVLSLISKLLSSNINSLSQSYPLYEDNIGGMIVLVNELFKINISEMVKANSGDFDFGSILTNIFQSLTDLLSNTFIIIIYALFIFLEESNFYNKIRLVFTAKAEFDNLNDIMEKIEKSIASYIGLKTLVSLITGVTSYLVLLLIGIDAPLFWGFLIFLLNYIPTVGSLIGTLFPAVFCMLQFGGFAECFMVLGFVGVIQVLVGNFIEPKLMGNSLNVSPMIAILSLSFWGAIWGVTGMFLSVPITVIMVIVFSHFQSTKSIAIMLSEKGIVYNDK